MAITTTIIDEQKLEAFVGLAERGLRRHAHRRLGGRSRRGLGEHRQTGEAGGQ